MPITVSEVPRRSASAQVDTFSDFRESQRHQLATYGGRRWVLFRRSGHPPGPLRPTESSACAWQDAGSHCAPMQH